MVARLRATERHLPYEITECYRLSTQVNAPCLNWPILDLLTPEARKAELAFDGYATAMAREETASSA